MGRIVRIAHFGPLHRGFTLARGYANSWEPSSSYPTILWVRSMSAGQEAKQVLVLSSDVILWHQKLGPFAFFHNGGSYTAGQKQKCPKFACCFLSCQIGISGAQIQWWFHSTFLSKVCAHCSAPHLFAWLCALLGMVFLRRMGPLLPPRHDTRECPRQSFLVTEIVRTFTILHRWIRFIIFKKHDMRVTTTLFKICLKGEIVQETWPVCGAIRDRPPWALESLSYTS